MTTPLRNFSANSSILEKRGFPNTGVCRQQNIYEPCKILSYTASFIKHNKTLSNTKKHYRTHQNIIEDTKIILDIAKNMTLQRSQLNIIDDMAKHYQTEQNIIRYTAKHNFTVQNIAFVQVAKPYCTYQTSLGKKSLLHVPVDYRRQSKT